MPRVLDEDRKNNTQAIKVFFKLFPNARAIVVAGVWVAARAA